MNCQEVMEYMQRELDGDLGEIESAKLREHIRHCADCAEMYERLKRLSTELENLPKVTPPFSLVDAILPKLEEIDRAASAANRDAGPAGPGAGAAGIPDQDESAPSTPRRRVSRFNLRVLGGVVAAGIVAGVFLVTYDRDATSDLLSGHYAAESASSDSSSSASSSGSSEPVLMFGAVNQMGEVTDQYGSSPDPSAGAGDAADSSASAPEVRPTSGSDLKTPHEKAVGGGTDPEAKAGSAPGSDSGAHAGSDGRSASDGAEDADRMTLPAVRPGESVGIVAESEEPAEKLEGDGQLGITAFPEEPAASSVESVSPDGSYIAVFADSRVIIYDRNGNTRFEGEEREGAIAAFGWTDDGAFFRYEIRRGDGTGEIYRIDPAAGTETREP